MPFVEFYENKIYNEQESCSIFSLKNNVIKKFEKQQESQERAEQLMCEIEEQHAKEKYSRIFEH